MKNELTTIRIKRERLERKLYKLNREGKFDERDKVLKQIVDLDVKAFKIKEGLNK